MKKYQIFLIGILMLSLAVLTGIISMYALNPEFASYLRGEVAGKAAENEVPLKEMQSEPRAGNSVPQTKDPGEMTEDFRDDDSIGIEENIPAGYIAPSETELEVPENLSDKTGYGEITVTEKIVSDEEADRIEEELSTGPLGEELDFDPLFYPYYSMLDERGKSLYRQIYANIIEMNPAFKSVDSSLTRRRIDSAFEAVFNDHPELFWIDTGYRTIYRRNGDFLELDLFYNDTASNIETSRSEFNAAAAAIISEASGSDYEKERFVHNRLSELFDYQRNPLDQSAYSGLVGNKTVCAGYARSFSYIMTQLGIPCYLCTGFAGESHGWNIVRLDGDYYNVDVTWDDTGTDKPYYYDWFNKTDDDFRSTHIRKSLSVYLPPCNGTTYRDLEPEDPWDSDDTPTLESVGFSEGDVIRDMHAYYDELYEGMLKLGKGRHTYSMVISEELLEECSKAYDNAEIKDRVLGKVLEDTGGTNANVSCKATKLKGGYYLVEHMITIK